jgi:tetratricopeptide (TPR) repeat protein
VSALTASTPEELYARFKQDFDNAETAGDADGLLRVGTAWVEAFPTHATPANRLAEVHRQRGNLNAALDVVQSALRHHPKDALLLKRASKLCAHLHDLDSAIEYRLLCAEIPGEERECMLEVARFRITLADAAGAREALDAAFAAGEPREKHRLSLAHIAYLQRDRDGGLALLESELAEAGSSPAIDNIRKKLQQLSAERPAGKAPIRLRSPATSELQAWAHETNVPTGALNASATRLITEAGDILIERVADSRALLLAFGGLSTMFGGTAEDMGFLVRNVRINAMFVSDPQRLFMLGGFASVGEYWTTVGWLKDLKQAWSIDHIYCLGLSGGGYPALRYGLDVGARRVLTFAAPTEITPTITQTDKRATALANRVLTRRPHMCVNLRDEIAKLGEAAPEIINYYGGDMPEDAYHARNIEGLPTVSSRRVDGLASHGVIAWLKQTGTFRDILQEFLREALPPAPPAPAPPEPLKATWSSADAGRRDPLAPPGGAG